MKPVASFKNNNKQSIDLTKDGLDYSKLYQDRTNEKKVFYKKNKKFYHKDAVYFVDLGTTADYGAFFVPYLDDKMSLNTKGPFANLFWCFTCEEINGERRVS